MSAGWSVHLGHGASGSAASMAAYVEGLARRGFSAAAVQLPKGSAERAMPAFLGQSGEGASVVVGGQSFGGRVASLLAAQHRFGALLLFSYPLHRPGHRGELRTDHWPDIRCPVLLLSGESDPFADLQLLRREVVRIPDHRLVTFPRAGHGFRGPLLEEALDHAAAFLSELGPERGQ